MNSSVRPLSLLGSSLVVALMLSGCGPSKTELAKEIATLKEQLSQRQTEGKTLEQQIASVRSELNAERKALNEAKAAAENSAGIVSELRAAQAVRDVRVAELSRNREQQDEKVRELAKVVQEHEARQTQLQRDLDSASASARQVQTERDAAVASARQVQAERDAAMASARQVQTERDAAVASARQVQTERDTAVASARQVQAERDAAVASARQVQAELQQRLEQSQVAQRSAASERDSMVTDLARAREQLASIDRDLKQNTGNLEQEQKRASDLTDRLSAALGEQSKLRQSTDAQRAEIASISAALAQAQAKVALLTGARGIYTVQEGDSLSSIALYFYRNASRWPGVAQANRHLINHPDKIFPAMVLIIPK
ncbi:MAG: LysM peptidoglycan-binding domain-containing protein [Betaproteobacteria bacterium]